MVCSSKKGLNRGIMLLLTSNIIAELKTGLRRSLNIEKLETSFKGKNVKWITLF